MTLTKDGSRKMAHDLLMEDFPINQLGRLTDDEMIEAWISYHQEPVPQSWLVQEEDHG